MTPAAIVVASVLGGHCHLLISPAIDDEYATSVFRRSVMRLLMRRGVSLPSAQLAIARLRLAGEMVVPTGEAPPCRDEQDRMYLHCAVASRADFLLSYDHDLLDLGTVEGIPIVTPDAFVQLSRARGWPLAE